MELSIRKYCCCSAVVIALIMHVSVRTVSGETGLLIARGWYPGEYFFTGPDSSEPDFIPSQTLYFTDDYGQSIEAVYTGCIGIMTDALENCCYGSFLPDHDYYSGRSWDSGRTWEEIGFQPFTTGRTPGEGYALGRGDSIRYSDNYCDSYESFLSEGLHPNGLLVGHRDGEIYSTGYDLWRSEDFGRHFEIIYENQDDDSIGFSNHNWLTRGVEDGELYIFDEGFFRVFRSVDRGQSWVMQSDIEYPEYAEERLYYWDITAGVDPGEVVIYGFTFNYFGGGTMKFLVSDDYGQSFEEYTPFDYDPTWIRKPECLTPQLNTVESFPNPFNDRCVIEVNIADPQFIGMSVIDGNGRFVRQVTRGFYNRGSYRFIWSPEDGLSGCSNGCYFIVFNGQDGRILRNLVMIK